MPDEVTYRVEAQQELDIMQQFGVANQLGVPLWQTRADNNIEQWKADKITTSPEGTLFPAMESGMTVLVAAQNANQISAVRNVHCYSTAQLQAVHTASIANAQAVIDLFNQLRP